MAFHGFIGLAESSSDDESNDDIEKLILKAQDSIKSTRSTFENTRPKSLDAPTRNLPFELPTLTSESSEDDSDGDLDEPKVLEVQDLKQRFYGDRAKTLLTPVKDDSKDVEAVDDVFLVKSADLQHGKSSFEEYSTYPLDKVTTEELEDSNDEPGYENTGPASGTEELIYKKENRPLRKLSSGIFSQEGSQSTMASIGAEEEYQDSPPELNSNANLSANPLESEVPLSDSGVFESPTLTIPTKAKEQISQALAFIDTDLAVGDLDIQTEALDNSSTPALPSEEADANGPHHNMLLLDKLEDLHQKQKTLIQSQTDLFTSDSSSINYAQRDSRRSINTKHLSESPVSVTSWGDIKPLKSQEKTTHSLSDTENMQETIFLDLRPKPEEISKGLKDGHLPCNSLPSISYYGLAARQSSDSDDISCDDDGDFLIWSDTRKKLKMQSSHGSCKLSKTDKRLNKFALSRSNHAYPSINSCHSEETIFGKDSCKSLRNSSIPENDSVNASLGGSPNTYCADLDIIKECKTVGKNRLQTSNMEDESELTRYSQEKQSEGVEDVVTASEKEIDDSREYKERFIAKLCQPAVQILDEYQHKILSHGLVTYSSSEDSSLDEEPVASLLDCSPSRNGPEGFKGRMNISNPNISHLSMKRGSFGSYDLVDSPLKGVDNSHFIDKDEVEYRPRVKEDTLEFSPEIAVGCFGLASNLNEDEGAGELVYQELESFDFRNRDSLPEETQLEMDCFRKDDQLDYTTLTEAKDGDTLYKGMRSSFTSKDIYSLEDTHGQESLLKLSTKSVSFEPSEVKEDGNRSTRPTPVSPFKEPASRPLRIASLSKKIVKENSDFTHQGKRIPQNSKMEGMANNKVPFTMPDPLLDYLNLKIMTEHSSKIMKGEEDFDSRVTSNVMDPQDINSMSENHSSEHCQSTQENNCKVLKDSSCVSSTMDEDDSTDLVKKKKNKKKGNKNSSKGSSRDKPELTAKDAENLIRSNPDVKLPVAKDSSKSSEQQRKNKNTSSKRETDHAKLKETMKKFLRANDFPPIMYDEELSFADEVSGLPFKMPNKSCLLLSVSLQAPGICDRQPNATKTTLSTLEGINGYIGLSTLFLSLTPRKKKDVSLLLDVPFHVISFQQIDLDNELKLCIGVTENEITAKQLKKGKSSKIRKTFFHLVAQFLNSTDLDAILDKLENISSSGTRESIIRAPSSGKLSSFVTVNRDENALNRVFSLSPSLFWSLDYKPGAPLSSNVTWLPKDEPNNEISVLTVESFVSIQPRELYFFFSKISTMDIVGIRLVYLQSTDNSDGPCVLVLALSDIASTSIQGANKLVPVLYNKINIFVSYMPRDLKIMQSYFSDPLLTYSIGRRRADRELTFWFGRRLSRLSEAELLAELSTYQKPNAKPSPKSTPGEANVFPSQGQSVHFLTSVVSRTLIVLSPLVPASFLPAVVEILGKMGLAILSLGKLQATPESAGILGLTESGCGPKIEVKLIKSKEGLSVPDHKSIWGLVVEGENAVYRAVRVTERLTNELLQQLPSNSSLHNSLDKTRSYSHRKSRRATDFFSSVSITPKIVQQIEDMCSLPTNTTFHELKPLIPSSFMSYRKLNQPEFCVVAVTGQKYTDQIINIITLLLKNTSESDSAGEVKNGYYKNTELSAEIAGVKFVSKMTSSIADEVNPKILGNADFTSLSSKLKGQPLVLIVFRGDQVSDYLSNQIPNLERTLLSNLSSEECLGQGISSHNIFLYDHGMAVIKFMTMFFNPTDLPSDLSLTAAKNTIWPIYLYDSHWAIKDRSLLSIPSNAIRSVKSNAPRLFESKEAIVRNFKPAIVNIVHPLSLNLPHLLLLDSDSVGFSVLTIDVNVKFLKVLTKAMQRIVKDGFVFVGLKYPETLPPKCENQNKMLVALRRRNAVARLIDWIPYLEKEFNGRHRISVTSTMALALESILSNFKTPSGSGIFDWSPLSLTEELSFTQDDVFPQRHLRTVTWLDASAEQKHAADTKDLSALHTNLLEVNVILMSNGLIRGRYLGQDFSENLKCFGFWEKLCSLSFETLGCRITSLSNIELKCLLDECNVGKERRLLEHSLSELNGPFLALVLQRDFAIANFWMTIEKHYSAHELKFLRSNLLVPTSRNQVEVLLRSLFETISENPKVKITLQSSQKPMKQRDSSKKINP